MESRILDHWDAVHARVRRWRWGIRLAIAAVLLPWFWSFAHSRMFTPPSDPNALMTIGAAPVPDPATDLLQALQRIPWAPPLAAPPDPPAGMRWKPTKDADAAALPLASLDYMEALAGPWTPQSRHHLRAILDYIGSDGMTTSLKDVARLAKTTILPAGYYSMPLYSPVRHAAKCLVVRARSHVHGGNIEAAARDVGTILDLSAMLERDGVLIQHLVAAACRALAYSEMIEWTRVTALKREEVRVLLAVLNDHPLDPAAQWRSMHRGETIYVLRMLDGYYTQTDDGNGWHVAYMAADNSLSQKAPCLLNLLSPFINDRRTITHKIEQAAENAIQAADRPLVEALEVMRYDPNAGRYQQALTLGNPADGLAGASILTGCGSVYLRLVQRAVRESSTRICLALAAYKTEHGRYPIGLANLVPGYLSSVPLDPADGKPMRYRLDDRDGYSLYSIGQDGLDQGGVLRDASGKPYGLADSPDWLTSVLPRDEPQMEWHLVPIEDTEGERAADEP